MHFTIHLFNPLSPTVDPFYMATSTHHSSHSSVASSTQHNSIISWDHVYLLRLLDAMDSDDNHDDKFEGQLDLQDSF